MLETKIEWCDSTFNPITGCLHKCPYCYARRTATRFKGCDIAPNGETDQKIVALQERLISTLDNGKKVNAAYPYGFTPTLHEYRLDDFKTKHYGKTVFVCSMADMFGAWIPDEWIGRIFAACKDSPEHRYLFLTKNPGRYLDLAEKGMLPEEENFWYGTTCEGPGDPMFFSQLHHTFVSVEPILKPWGNGGEDGFAKKTEWAIFGAETGNRRDKVIPQRGWIEGVVNEFRREGKPVFMKDSMKPVWGEDLFTETPWDR